MKCQNDHCDIIQLFRDGIYNKPLWIPYRKQNLTHFKDLWTWDPWNGPEFANQVPHWDWAKGNQRPSETLP